jgi:hypothetical protein
MAILLMLTPAVAQGVSSLTVGEVTYENVTLKKEYPRSFFIKHDGGTAFIERSNLSEEQIAELLQAGGEVKPAAAQTETETEAKAETDEVKYVHPSPESLSSDEERKFFEACANVDTPTIVAMLKENPSLATVTMNGQGQLLIMGQMVDDEIIPARHEPAEATCDALQWLIDESEKSPERIEAIKALVEAGADLTRTTSVAGANMSRNTVSRPDMLTLEELDYLLSKGANPDFGFCTAAYPPAGVLAKKFVTEEDAEKKEEARKFLEMYIMHGADPKATGSPSFGGGVAEVAESAGNTDLDEILARAKK